MERFAPRLHKLCNGFNPFFQVFFLNKTIFVENALLELGFNPFFQVFFLNMADVVALVDT